MRTLIAALMIASFSLVGCRTTGTSEASAIVTKGSTACVLYPFTTYGFPLARISEFQFTKVLSEINNVAGLVCKTKEEKDFFLQVVGRAFMKVAMNAENNPLLNKFEWLDGQCDKSLYDPNVPNAPYHGGSGKPITHLVTLANFATEIRGKSDNKYILQIENLKAIAISNDGQIAAYSGLKGDEKFIGPIEFGCEEPKKFAEELAQYFLAATANFQTASPQ